MNFYQIGRDYRYPNHRQKFRLKSKIGYMFFLNVGTGVRNVFLRI